MQERAGVNIVFNIATSIEWLHSRCNKHKYTNISENFLAYHCHAQQHLLPISKSEVHWKVSGDQQARFLETYHIIPLYLPPDGNWLDNDLKGSAFLRQEVELNTMCLYMRIIKVNFFWKMVQKVEITPENEYHPLPLCLQNILILYWVVILSKYRVDDTVVR